MRSAGSGGWPRESHRTRVGRQPWCGARAEFSRAAGQRPSTKLASTIPLRAGGSKPGGGTLTALPMGWRAKKAGASQHQPSRSGAGTRTPIRGTKILCPAIRRRRKTKRPRARRGRTLALLSSPSISVVLDRKLGRSPFLADGQRGTKLWPRCLRPSSTKSSPRWFAMARPKMRLLPWPDPRLPGRRLPRVRRGICASSSPCSPWARASSRS